MRASIAWLAVADRLRKRAVFATALSALLLALLGASPAFGASLPDNRAYELVSTGNTGEPFTPTSPLNRRNTELNGTELPVQASEDGESITYAGETALAGGTGTDQPGEGNQWYAQRTDTGWNTAPITPETGVPGETGFLAYAPYEAFSPDLSTQIIEGAERRPLTTDVPVGCRGLYVRDATTGVFRALFTPSEAPNNVHTAICGDPLFAGAAEHDSKVIFQSQAALTVNATAATEIPPARQEHSEQSEPAGRGCMFGCNLYEAIAGHLRLVSVLPGGQVVANATFGGYPGPVRKEMTNFSNAISSDGSRIFWTDTQPGEDSEHVFVLENGTTTVQVSGAAAAEYWTATPDGRYAYYTEAGQLWQFDTTTNTREPVTPVAAGVQGVIGTNQTGQAGSYLYFVAGSSLAPGSAPKICTQLPEQSQQAEREFEKGLITKEEDEAVRVRVEKEEQEEANGGMPATTGCNLYLRHEGRTSLIAVLSPQDNRFEAGGASRASGDWKANLGERTAEITPDGRNLLFQSRYPLTGYHNIGPERRTIAEVFAYSADAARISCASCDPAGTPPTAKELSIPSLSRLPVSLEDNVNMHRWISDDGNRVFFDSQQPLSATDKNVTQDVYEWEREGTPGCPSATSVFGGCVYLLSGASTSGYSFLVDADATGGNVFFEHAGPLGTVAATPGRNELYDARVGGGFSSAPPTCRGGCGGAPPAPPSFETPASTAFTGADNYPPPAPAKPTPVKPLTNAQKLANAVKACHRQHNRHKRAACERQARKRYRIAHPAHKANKARAHHRGGTLR